VHDIYHLRRPRDTQCRRLGRKRASPIPIRGQRPIPWPVLDVEALGLFFAGKHERGQKKKKKQERRGTVILNTLQSTPADTIFRLRPFYRAKVARRLREMGTGLRDRGGEDF